MSFSTFRPVLLCSVGFLVACGDPAGPAGEPAELVPVSGDAQQDTVGRQLEDPLVVRALDAAGRPVPGHPVSFVVTAGGGSVFVGSTVTDESGLAQDRWTLGTAAGPQRVEARTLTRGGEPVDPAVFTATAVADAPARVATVAGDEQTGPVGAELPAQLVVEVTDAFGNPTPGVPLTWTVTAGEGALTGAAGETDPEGRGSAAWTLGPRMDAQSVSVSAPGAEPAVFTATATVAGELALVQGDAQTDTVAATLGQDVLVSLRLPDGRPVVDAAVQWSASAGSAAPAMSRTDESGLAATRWTLGTTAGTQSLTATVEGAGSVSATATATPGAPVEVRITPDSAVLFPVGDTAAFSASAFDRFGNAVPDAGFTWSSTDPDVVTVDGAGIASATGTGRADVQARTGAAAGLAAAIVSRGDIAFASDRDGEFDIFVMNSDGTAVFPLTRAGGWDYYPAFSPGGDTIAFTSDRDGNQDIYLMDLHGAILARLTDYPGVDSYPTWSPDGTRIAFERQEEDGSWNLYVIEVAGGTPTRITSDPGGSARFPDWSPQGNRIAYTKGPLNSIGSFQTATIHLIDPDGSNSTAVPGRTAQQEYWPSWSPDGARIAYVAATVLAVMNVDGSGRRDVFSYGFSGPDWSPSGHRLVFGGAPDANFTASDLYSVAPDGSESSRLTATTQRTDASPSWRPAGPPD